MGNEIHDYNKLGTTYGLDESVFKPWSPPMDLSEFKHGMPTNRITYVDLEDGVGPDIHSLRPGTSPLEKDAIPAADLDPSVKLLLEALPKIPDYKVCAPLTPEQGEKYKGQIIGLCNAKTGSEMTDGELQKWREQRRVHLGKDDRVAKTPDGDYLIFHPDIYFRM